jgi:fatty acid desaturase
MAQPQPARELPEELSFDAAAHRLVADLHVARPGRYWADVAITAVVGWGAFGLAISSPSFSALQIGALLLASFALYRGLCFIHEITHLRSKAVPGFEPAWNILFGAPLLMPSFVYAGVHQNHHTLGTYGTEDDPEYLPFSSSHWMTVIFAIHSVLIPLALLLRFFVLAPAAMASPKIRQFVVRHASSLSMNTAYVRRAEPGLVKKMIRSEITIWAIWGLAIFAARTGGGPLRVLACWYAMTAFASVVNALRTLAAHRYEGGNAPRSRTAQLVDSVDVPGGWWTELWAPVGLRYHALHHYFPGIPYHNLGTAYRRLMAKLPDEAPYRQVTVASLRSGLGALFARGRLNFSEQRKIQRVL